MARIILVTGGARSGKSSYAESFYHNQKDVVYIATAKIYDDEMRERVAFHQRSRPQGWITVEGTYNLHELICQGNQKYLLDCISLLASNVMFDVAQNYTKIPIAAQREVEDLVLTEIQRLVEKIKHIDGTLVMVTNEVGSSVVPENHIARVYRDILGNVNQRTACLCDEVYLVACGLALQLK